MTRQKLEQILSEMFSKSVVAEDFEVYHAHDEYDLIICRDLLLEAIPAEDRYYDIVLLDFEKFFNNLDKEQKKIAAYHLEDFKAHWMG